jgi:hypothetical protein
MSDQDAKIDAAALAITRAKGCIPWHVEQAAALRMARPFAVAAVKALDEWEARRRAPVSAHFWLGADA